MIKKDFDVFANRYRLILEKGVKNYPEYYSKSTMLEYDRFIYESKKSLKKSNLLEGWRMPSISYIHPLQLVEKSLLSESHYIAINKLDEGFISKVGGYLQRGVGRVFGAGSSQTLKDQGTDASGGGGQVLGAGGVVDTDQTLAVLRDKHKSFRDQLTAVIALKNWSERKTGIEPFWSDTAKMEKKDFDSELAAIEKEIREALPEIEKVAPLAEALSSRNRLARLSEVAITQGLFERAGFALPPGVINNDSPNVSSAQLANIQAQLHIMFDNAATVDTRGKPIAVFAHEEAIAKIAQQHSVSPLAVRGIAHQLPNMPGGNSLSVDGHLPAQVIVKDGETITKTLDVPPPNPPGPTPTLGPHPAPTPGPDQPPAPPGRPGPEHPPAPHTDPHAPPHAYPKPHGHDGGGHSKLLWGALAAIVTAGIYGGMAMRKRRQRLEKLIAVKKIDVSDTAPIVALPAETPGEVAVLPKVEELRTAEAAEKAAKPKNTPDDDFPKLTYGPAETEVLPALPPEVGENGLKKIYVYKGKGGQGFQSRVAQKINKIPGMNPRDVGRYQSISSKVMNALAKDLKNTGKFTVLESSRKADSDNASLVATLAELDKVTQPQVREILRFEIYHLLRGAGLKVKSDILKKGSSPEVSLESEADATDTSSAEVKGSAEKGKEGTKTPTEKSPDEILKAKLKSRLSSFNANEKQVFSKAEWEELFSANDKSFGGDGQEARFGRDVIRKHHNDPSMKTGVTYNPEYDATMKQGNDDYQELVKLKNYGSVMESLRRKYRLGLITLREYSIRKQKIEMIVLKEQIKRQILSTRK